MMLRSGRRRLLITVLGVLAVACSLAPAVSAKPGDLDRSFGSNGTFSLGSPADVGRQPAFLADGRIVAAVTPGTSAVRLTSAGALDPSFGFGGIATVPSGPPSLAAVPQADGAVVVAAVSGQDYVVRRFGPTGAPDGTYGTSGVATVRVGRDPHDSVQIWRVLLQADGKLLVVGATRHKVDRASDDDCDTKLLLARLLPSGAPDPGFGAGGLVQEPYAHIKVMDAALAPNGRINVSADVSLCEQSDSSKGKGGLAVRRYLPDGSVDRGYGSRGWSRAGRGFFPIRAIALQKDGKAIVVGFTGKDNRNRITLTRFRASGKLDREFGEEGRAVVPVTNDSQGTSVAVQPNGRILVAGSAQTKSCSNCAGALARLRSNGRIDSGFGNDGSVVLPRTFFQLNDLSVSPAASASSRPRSSEPPTGARWRSSSSSSAILWAGMRLAICIAAAATALLVLPTAAADAATTLAQFVQPTGQEPPCDNPGCTVWNRTVNAAAVQPAGLASPIDGVVVKALIRGLDKTHPFRLRVLSDNGGTAQRFAISDQLLNDTPAKEHPVRLSIKKGQFVGLQVQAGTALPSVFAAFPQTVSRAVFSSPLAPDAAPVGAVDTGQSAFLFTGTVESDFDNDGFGDETQDACPINPLTAGACPATGLGTTPDTVAPAISDVSAKPDAFRTKNGTTLRFKVSELSAIFYTVDKAKNGRKVGGKCVRPTRGNSGGKRCDRYVVVGKFLGFGLAGKNKTRFDGKVKEKALKEGRYRLRLRAMDVAGNLSKRVPLKFRIASP